MSHTKLFSRRAAGDKKYKFVTSNTLFSLRKSQSGDTIPQNFRLRRYELSHFRATLYWSDTKLMHSCRRYVAEGRGEEGSVENLIYIYQISDIWSSGKRSIYQKSDIWRSEKFCVYQLSVENLQKITSKYNKNQWNFENCVSYSKNFRLRRSNMFYIFIRL